MSRLLPALLLALAPQFATAAEGMWPFNMAPTEQVKREHGFEITPPWLERAQRASVRFNNGGSGSFVANTGLVMTNHHVGIDCIQKLSQGEHDYVKDGFLAATHADEAKCPDLELNRLESIEDVTAKVKAAEKGADDAAKNTARKSAMSAIEKACNEKTGMRCDVVTLYAGGAYHLYRYRKFTDVRLVFAPEIQIAFFGGDPDNFNFPRACLDVAFFRVYTDDTPAKTEHHFTFSAEGAKEGQLVFVSGHPGSTGRLHTPARLAFLRDTAYPYVLQKLKALRGNLEAYMAKGESQSRAARKTFFGVENAIKAVGGYLGGLSDPAVLKEANRRHDEVKAKVKGDAALQAAWTHIAKAYGGYAAFYTHYATTERRQAPGGDLARIARHLVRWSDEKSKPNGERLREYRDSGLDSLKLRLFSEAPIDDGLQVELLAYGLENMREALGADHAVVKAALGGQSPRARAEAVVSQTKLKDVATRKTLFEKGVAGSKDPLVELVRSYDAAARTIRARYEAEVEAVDRRWSGKIAEAWAKAHGRSTYPDATFTLRLNHGVVKGYEGTKWTTTYADLYAKHDAAKGARPYDLPKRWLDAKSKLDLTVPYDFISTNDIIGGNSGSPVFDQELRVVGLIFDGNIDQLSNRFLYRDATQRAVSVNTAAITHALQRVYGATALLAELGVGAK